MYKILGRALGEQWRALSEHCSALAVTCGSMVRSMRWAVVAVAALLGADARPGDVGPARYEIKRHVSLIHIPKNAGSALGNALRANGLGQAKRQAPGIVKNIGCPSVHTPPRYYPVPPDRRRSENVATIATLRHPYERAISQYTWGSKLWSEHLGYGKTAPEMNRFIRDSVANASAPPRFFRAPGTLGNKKRLRKSEEHAEALGLSRAQYEILGGGAFVQGCHWVPQAHFVWSADGARNVDVTFCVGGTRSLLRDVSSFVFGRPDGIPEPTSARRRARTLPRRSICRAPARRRRTP